MSIRRKAADAIDVEEAIAELATFRDDSDASVHERFEPVRSEKARRETRRKAPPVVTWEPTREDAGEYPFRPPEGTVMLFWGATGTEIIDDLETAIVTRNLDRMQELGEGLLEAKQIQSGELPSLEESIERSLEAPALFDFSYGSRELAKNLALDETPVGGVTFPYTGGEIDTGDFTILEYPCRWPDECPPEPPWPEDFPWPDEWPPDPMPPEGPYDYLVVVSPPDLSDVERRAIETIPPDVREANILPSPVASTAAAAVVAVALAMVAITSSAPGIHDDLAEVTLPDRMVDRLGGRAAVGELLDMRREVLSNHIMA